VEKTLKTLQLLAEFHRLQSQFKVLAITGSNGKTTTKELCKAVLSEKFKVYATEGNLNNHIGVPLTLLAMDSNIEIGIVEMGANHPGEISLLCDIAHPDCGLITNVGKAHLEGFAGIEGVARAKGEMFSYLMRNNKTVFLNQGNEYVRNLVPGNYPNVVYYNGPGGLQAQHVQGMPLLSLGILHQGREVSLQTNLMGRYNAENILAACCVGMHMGITMESVIRAVRSYKPQNNRSQFIDTGKNKLYMDAYNANPSSMRAAIDEFLLSDDQDKLVILGEMRELGDDSAREHTGIIEYLRERGITRVICIGKSFKEPIQHTGFLYFDNTDQLIEHLERTIPVGQFIFIKGSRSNRLEKAVPYL
jgi:UDP-N-acetylmuramoyl-tripeptide--D-alanyl-D-alanine ligase